ncbi:N-acetyltransferase family protein [Frankia sp. CiP3]|uniref:GNAT family N-acetyltransferase n=1 Tax=Frankia sp. CiP3 TaxID=2880971 RepID=UPI0035B3920F
MDIYFRTLGSDDISALRQVGRLYLDVFDEEGPVLDDAYLRHLLEEGRALFFVAEAQGEVIGAVTAYMLPSVYGAYSEMYMYDMAVASAHQRQGIGGRLLTYIKQYCQAAQVKTLFVQADTPDTEARNFYRNNGGVEEDVRHYDFPIAR